MALHTDLPIYRTGVRLLDLAVKVQVQRGHVVAGDMTKIFRRTAS